MLISYSIFKLKLNNIDKREMSEIADFYSESTIFITGATGFLGKLLLEKLLRTCNNLKKVYLLIRPKKGKTTDQRFQEIFEAAVRFKQKITFK